MIKETSYVDDINTANNGVKIDVAYNDMMKETADMVDEKSSANQPIDNGISKNGD